MDDPRPFDAPAATRCFAGARLPRDDFHPLGLVEGVDPTARRALIRASTATPVVNGPHRAWFDPAGCDLSLLASGRAPLLLGHELSIRATVGVIETAWREGDTILAIARFGHGPDAETAWANVAAGVWINVSAGCWPDDVEADPQGGFVVRAWRPHELSLVHAGWVPDAHVLPTHDMASLARLSQERRAAAAREAAAQAARHREAARAGDVARLARVGDFIAPRLGLDGAAVQAAMGAFVDAVHGPEGAP
jgi:hypothetical protein